MLRCSFKETFLKVAPHLSVNRRPTRLWAGGFLTHPSSSSRTLGPSLNLTATASIFIYFHHISSSEPWGALPTWITDKYGLKEPLKATESTRVHRIMFEIAKERNNSFLSLSHNEVLLNTVTFLVNHDPESQIISPVPETLSPVYRITLACLQTRFWSGLNQGAISMIKCTRSHRLPTSLAT